MQQHTAVKKRQEDCNLLPCSKREKEARLVTDS
jgi:hypothetical protein